jgi:hypothetical protein
MLFNPFEDAQSREMALQYRINYRLIDEDGKAIRGVAVGAEDVREMVKILNKKFRDNKQLYLELDDSWDDQLNQDDLGILDPIV